MMEKRKKSIGLSALVNVNFSDESSEDSDFRIEDHCEESEDDDSINSEEYGNKYNGVCEEKESGKTYDKAITTKSLLQEQLQKQTFENFELSKLLICCICLGDESNDDNEIVECDSCGVTVHECCYGISEDDSVISSSSAGSTAPWFCEACQAGVDDPSCELCPNLGGIFKETDTGKWVHLVCALYIPGVAFKDVDKLSNVTLFEMSYSKWSERACSLCSDQQYSRTGVCIGCDAGLCRTYFHVTCGQKEGLLTEARSEEINHADPFYAHCKLHSDKELMKLNKRNWLALQLQLVKQKKQKETEASNDFQKNSDINSKLQKYQKKYANTKLKRPQPWVPTQKMPRPLISSAKVLRSLSRKAMLSGIDTLSVAIKEAQTSALVDVHRKWHIPPAFNMEYMGYYLDRNARIDSLKQNIAIQMDENSKLIKEQRELEANYSQARKDYNSEIRENEKLNSVLKLYHQVILKMDPNKKLPALNQTASFHTKDYHPSFDVTVKKINTSSLKRDMNFSTCGICGLTNDQHLLVNCDTCQLYYHLGCLDPPLTRMPKKTKIMGWQCSECDKSSSDSDNHCVDTETPRQLRQIKSSWNKYTKSPKEFLKSGKGIEKETHVGIIKGGPENSSARKKPSKMKSKRRTMGSTTSSSQIIQSRKRDQVNINYGTSEIINEPSSSLHPVVHISPLQPVVHISPLQPVVHISPLQPFDGKLKTATNNKLSSSISCNATTKTQNVPETEVICNSCNSYGSRANIVTCDECLKNFHFQCLNPPVKKSPKVKGYSWHCADCDPTESDSD